MTTAENRIWCTNEDSTSSIIHAAGVRMLRYWMKAERATVLVRGAGVYFGRAGNSEDDVGAEDFVDNRQEVGKRANRAQRRGAIGSHHAADSSQCECVSTTASGTPRS